MPFLTFEDIDIDSRDAARIHFNEDASIIELDKQARYQISPTKKDPLVILGHTQDIIQDYIFWKKDKTAIGPYTAQDMADRLVQIIPRKYRNQVEDIYLISCEAGWNDSQKSCYARELACALYNKGFKQIKVHTITSPTDCDRNYAGMRVELITRGGVKSRFGDAKAFLCTVKYEALGKEINKLESKCAKLDEQIRQDSRNLEIIRKRSQIKRLIFQKLKIQAQEKQAHIFMETDNLRAELDKPENTFIGAVHVNQVVVKAKQQAKQKEIEQFDNYAEIMAFLKHLQAQYRHNDKKLFKNITALLTMFIEQKENWGDVIFQAMDKYHQTHKLNVFKNRKNSSFYDLLIHLVMDYKLLRRDLPSYNDLLQQELFAFEHFVINKTKPGYCLTIMSDADELTEFTFKNQDELEAKLTTHFKRKEKNAAPDSENPRDALLINTEIRQRKVPNPENQSKVEEIKQKYRPVLPDVSHYYAYAEKPRSYHFWNEAKVETDNVDYQGLKGDALKGKILENFKKTIEACRTNEKLNKTIDKLEHSEEYKTLRQSQGLFTAFFRLKTDSIKAFEKMIDDQCKALSCKK